MGSILKPNMYYVGSEVTHTVNSATNVYSRNTPEAVETALFGNTNGNYSDTSVWYFYDNTYFLDITFDKDCNIWALPSTSSPTYNGTLICQRWNGTTWEDSGLIESPRSTIVGFWSKIFSNVPKGRYKFSVASGVTYRNEGEWYLEDPTTANKIKTKIIDLKEIGDLIPCRYTTISGSVGTFSELGTTKASEISTISSATPNGSFNFIYIGDDYKGRKILIADRNIQYSISWDTLNIKGIATGEGRPIIHNMFTSFVAGYNFNELATASVQDITGVNNSSSISGTTIVEGVDGNARHFNGTSDYIGFSSSVIPLGAKSIRFKFRSSTIPSGSNGAILSNISSTSTKYGIMVNVQSSTGYLSYGIFNNSTSSNANVYSTINICDGNWHDILLTWDGTATTNAVKIYIDDMTAPNVTGTFVVETANAGSNLTIGKTALASPYQYFLNGDLDSLEIYRGVIDPQTDGMYLRSKSKYNYNIRLLTGGVSATDTDNEWDNYIVNSDLGGIITAGDNNIWNWSGIASWTSTTIATTSANRVIKGNATVSILSSLATLSTNTTTGFRPVLIVESLVTYKYLFQDGTNLKIFNNTIKKWETIGLYTSEELFLSSGMDDLTPVTQILNSDYIAMNNDGVLGAGKQFSCDLVDGIVEITEMVTTS